MHHSISRRVPWMIQSYMKSLYCGEYLNKPIPLQYGQRLLLRNAGHTACPNQSGAPCRVFRATVSGEHDVTGPGGP